MQTAQSTSRTKLTGWTPFWWPTRDEMRPYVEDDVIQCSMAVLEETTSDHADFWRISRNGQLFLLRGHTEDGARLQRARSVEPGTVIDLVLPVWRVGEILLYLARFAEAAGRGHTAVSIACQWTGLRGRHLVALSGDRDLLEDRVARASVCGSNITTLADRIQSGLPEIVRELVEPLYMLFDFFQPDDEFYSTELARLQQGRF
jgi:hypothetical protein